MTNSKSEKKVPFMLYVKTLLKSVRQYKKETFLTMLFVGLETILECVIPFIMMLLINDIEAYNQATGMETLYKILTWAAVLLVLAGFSLTCGILSGRFCAFASVGFSRNLRQDIYYKIQTFSFTNIDKFSVSSLVTRQTTDIMNIQLAYFLVIRIAVRSVLMLIFSIVMAFIAAPSIAWIYLILVPVLFGVLLIIVLICYPIYSAGFKKYDKLNESIQENVKGMRTVKTYVREDYEKEKFHNQAYSLQKFFKKADRLAALSSPILQFFMWTSMLCIISIGSFLIIQNNFDGVENGMTVGALTSLITYGAQCLSSIMMVTMILTMIIMSLESIHRVYEVLTEENKLLEENVEGAKLTNLDDGSIEYKDVYFRYDNTSEKYALEDINLKVKSGQTLGIIGATGSSKSTLVNLLPRFFEITKGSLTIGGHDIKEYDIRSLREQIGMVLQKNILFSGTIKDNLLWGNKDASDEQIVQACKVAQADEFIRNFKDGYNSRVEQGGTNLSGGQKQRLCIARAIIKNPKILILDDSTSAVDTKTDAFIRDGLKRVCPNTTKIIIAQRISSVQDCDQIIVMKDGKIDGIGNHDYLVKNNDIYKDIYNIQNKIGGSQE